MIQQGIAIVNIINDNLDKAINEFNKWVLEVIENLEEASVEPKKISELKVITHYKKNPFDVDSSKKVLSNVITNTITFLNITESKSSNTQLNEPSGLIVIRKILANFHLHIKAMYKDELHGRGTIQKVNLDKIIIENEYDVQRILYSLLKPIFPTARLEKNDDAGYGGIRYDIAIDEYSIIIETKCSRKSMTEKKLTEEIGADIYHYNSAYVFFFIYDKECIIKNPELFKMSYTNQVDGKNIETYIIQPINL